jgi:translation initiation factor IF-1
VIEEVLPKALYRVRLDDGRQIRAGLSPSLRHKVVRVIGGAKVVVKLSKFDPTRGQIIETI